MPEQWFADTDPATLAVYIDLYRNMTMAERGRRTF